MPAIESDVMFDARVINAPPMDQALPSSGCILLPATVGNPLPISGGSLGGLNNRPRLLPELRNGYPLVWRNGNIPVESTICLARFESKPHLIGYSHSR